MKHIHTVIFALFALITVFASCDDEATYADMRKAENKAIASFIKHGCLVRTDDGRHVMLHVRPIKEITEEQFEAKGYTTDTVANEYVLFASSGVYMQIMRQGTGEKLKDKESCQVICRFHEYNISSDTLQLSNRVSAYEQLPDVMTVHCTDTDTYTASFTQGLMYQCYGSAVPGGWLMPLKYINLGRQTSEEGEIAKIRLIVPSSEGQSYATKGIYACFYEVTMQRGR